MVVKVKCGKCGRTYDAMRKTQEVWCTGRHGGITIGHGPIRMRPIREEGEK